MPITPGKFTAPPLHNQLLDAAIELGRCKKGSKWNSEKVLLLSWSLAEIFGKEWKDRSELTRSLQWLELCRRLKIWEFNDLSDLSGKNMTDLYHALLPHVQCINRVLCGTHTPEDIARAYDFCRNAHRIFLMAQSSHQGRLAA